MLTAGRPQSGCHAAPSESELSGLPRNTRTPRAPKPQTLNPKPQTRSPKLLPAFEQAHGDTPLRSAPQRCQELRGLGLPTPRDPKGIPTGYRGPQRGEGSLGRELRGGNTQHNEHTLQQRGSLNLGISRGVPSLKNSDWLSMSRGLFERVHLNQIVSSWHNFGDRCVLYPRLFGSTCTGNWLCRGLLFINGKIQQ